MTDIATICAKLPKYWAVPVFRVALVVIFLLVFPLSCIVPAGKFVWELLGEFKDIFIEAPDIMTRRR